MVQKSQTTTVWIYKKNLAATFGGATPSTTATLHILPYILVARVATRHGFGKDDILQSQKTLWKSMI